MGHEGEWTKDHYVSKKYTIPLRTLYGRIKPLNGRFIVVIDETFLGQPKFPLLRLLDETVKHKMHIGEKGKVRDFSPFPVFPFTLWFLISCERC